MIRFYPFSPPLGRYSTRFSFRCLSIVVRLLRFSAI
nr:MAG TPA: hypothetical protein [Caudoviricetes sp.]